jgi:hypothetical protein
LSRYETRDIYQRHYFSRRLLPEGTYSVVGPAGRFSVRTIPPALKAKPGATAAVEAIERAVPDHFLFTGSQVIRAAVEAQSAKPEEELGINRFASLYLAVVEDVSTRVRSLLNGLYYVGPLRDRPRRFYELTGEVPDNVGTRGEHALELLFRKRNAPEAALVSTWLRRFGLPSMVDFEPFRDIGFSVATRRRIHAPEINYADTGFGFSQVLPLIIQGILGPPGSVLVAEQPEIHLNPQLQAMLGDLFVAIARSGRGVLLETHSEHMLLRLRRLIAQHRIKASDVALYFVERTGHSSHVRPIPIDEMAFIDPAAWPKGFFGSAIRDSIALGRYQSIAASHKREQTRPSRDAVPPTHSG